MKVVILAGGKGRRLFEETGDKPKSMVRIGDKPILWHVMNMYARAGFTRFIIALGYKGDIIAEQLPGECPPAWDVECVDTGLDTQTGGRIKRLASRLNERFMVTWCDGLADLDFQTLVDFHAAHKKLATLTAVRPVERFGHLELSGDKVVEFSEKQSIRERWINGAFFVLEPSVLDYIRDDATRWEQDCLVRLAQDDQLMAYKHRGFWRCMDTAQEARELNELWEAGCPWGGVDE